MSILVHVVNQKMHASSNVDGLVAGSQHFVKFKFNLSEEWNGLTVFAQFRQGTRAYNQYLDEENCVYLPAEIGVGACTMMLYGNHDTTIGTTNYLTFKIGDNHFVSDAMSTDISQSLYDQLVNKINENQSKFDELERKVTEFTTDEVITSLIEEAVGKEMAEYLASGMLANLAIADGSITRRKVDSELNDILTLAETSVLTTPQTLTDEQKTQAQKNIDAMPKNPTEDINMGCHAIRQVSYLGLSKMREDLPGEEVYASVTFRANYEPGGKAFLHAEDAEGNPVRIGGVAPGTAADDVATVGQLIDTMGDIETALDSIIAIQDSLIGGGAV